MFTWQKIIGLIAGCFSLLGFLPYLLTIYQKKTRPNRATWWIWTIVGFVILFSYHSSGANNTIWLPLFAAISHLIIAITSLKYGEGGWNNFDRVCIFSASISLLFWWWYNSPLIALLINIVIDFLGALPTIIKSHHRPETEALFPWLMFFLASILNICAIEQWSFSILVYPFYYFLSIGTIAFLLLRHQLKDKSVFKKRYRNRKYY